ncbi:MAG: long-chain fatty acid--CoA ligase [Castellaniella sp.]|uniref:AMP-binding protein n=1 Tax=Castellaniella sp. TaxID=1955812 RepID=UPI00120F42E0|nr:AMP-binding protein [Castellaniella sp.]TAN29705.1 MAG: long-chain fatty acid--CoA ligase [Castellaniella sp.]
MLDLGRSFVASVERDPGALAIVDADLHLSYGDWFDRIRRIEGGLEKLGIEHGDHVVAILQNRWEMATLHWACQLLGAIMTPLNWRAKADEVDYCLTISEARAVVYQDVSEEAVRAAPAAGKLPKISVGDLSGGTVQFGELLSSSYAGNLVNADASDWSLMLFTSGTTGRPKGVPRRHCHERSAALAHIAQNLYGRGECTLGVMPLYHTMGVRSLLSMAMINGCFVCVSRFDPAAVLRVIEQERVTNLYLVPTLYHDILAHQNLPATDISSVRKLGFAGASMTASLLKRLNETFKPNLFVNHYGSSEVYTCTIDQNAVAKPGSAGKAGLNQRIRVIKLDAQSGDEVAGVREEGQIIADLVGDEAFEGYWKRPDANEKALHGGWFLTGDLGYFDEDGDLFVTGRVDDMIISGGENISPTDIESLLSTHPAVDEVAVVGLPDPRWGQKVAAFIKLKAAATKDDLDAYCRESDLPNYKRPREYVFVEELPKSAVGKILRRLIAKGASGKQS